MRGASGRVFFVLAPQSVGVQPLERLKKYCSHSEREFLGFGEALAKESRQVGMTEPKRLVRRSLGEGGSQNPKRPLSLSSRPNGYSIYENALELRRGGFVAVGVQ